jgi:Domain of unknown function (DUF1844)
MSNDEEKPQRAFKVEDRRRFSETGEPRGPEPEPAEPPPGEPSATPPAGDAPQLAESYAADGDEEAEINFATFVLSLSTQALALLGEIPDPIDRSTRVDLAAARQIIDIIAMLQDKTRGNLEEAENALLENALYDLRMRYVNLVQQPR